MGCASLSSENSDPQKSERPWEYIMHMVAVIKCGHLWRKKNLLAKMNSVETCFPIRTEFFLLRESHSFGMFLIGKKSAKLLQQIIKPHSTSRGGHCTIIGPHFNTGPPFNTLILQAHFSTDPHSSFFLNYHSSIKGQNINLD